MKLFEQGESGKKCQIEGQRPDQVFISDVMGRYWRNKLGEGTK